MLDFTHNPISLEMLLNARDNRALRQKAWLDKWQTALVSLTLVSPGDTKDNAIWRYIMEIAIHEFNQIVANKNWLINKYQHWQLITGPEVFWSVGVDAITLKNITILLEEQHELGRFWDFDIIDPQLGNLSRRSLNYSGRKCFICEQPAHICSRTKKHNLPELLSVIKKKVNDYYTKNIIIQN